MEEKDIFNLVDEAVENEYFTDEEKDILLIFLKFAEKYYKNTNINKTLCEGADMFLSLWLPENIKKCMSYSPKAFISCINKVSFYANKHYGLNVSVRADMFVSMLERIADVNREFDRILNNPILSYEPFVIDLNRYKKKKNYEKRKNNSAAFSRDKGYYVVADIFSGPSVVLRKMFTGEFIKVYIDKETAARVRTNDILYISVVQNPFFSWDITEMKKYFPPQAEKYINRKIRKY